MRLISYLTVIENGRGSTPRNWGCRSLRSVSRHLSNLTIMCSWAQSSAACISMYGMNVRRFLYVRSNP